MDRGDQIFARDATTAANVLLHGRWKVHILCAMRSGRVRFGQLARTVRGASKKGLTKALRDLENDGLVSRRDLSTTVLISNTIRHEKGRIASWNCSTISRAGEQITRTISGRSFLRTGADQVRRAGAGTLRRDNRHLRTDDLLL